MSTLRKRKQPIDECGASNRKRQHTDDKKPQDESTLRQDHHVSAVKYPPEEGTVISTIKDSIHGQIELHPLCMKIVDTPQFQRLRSIRQLGGFYFNKDGEAHSRYEHSLGVCHLAGQLVTVLKDEQPKLRISDADILCVKIAGLCHDLGQGPFSHMFDTKFLPRMRPNTRIKSKHLSKAMFDHLMRKNRLDKEFENYGLTKRDITFIKEQIGAPPKDTSKAWPYTGRTKAKGFLYQIVANKKNGIDVDKWDYFARDCRMLRIMNNFDHTQCMKFARVLMVDGVMQICLRDKDIEHLKDMFDTQNTLQKRVYQQDVGNIIMTMIAEAMVKANDYIEIWRDDWTHDMDSYERLTDFIFEKILGSTDKRLKESKEILKRVQEQNVYKCVGHTVPAKNEFVSLDYGMQDEHRIDHFNLYKEDNSKKLIPVRRDMMTDKLAKESTKHQIRFYCKKADKESLKQATEAVQSWCKDHNCSAGIGNPIIAKAPVWSNFAGKSEMQSTSKTD